MTCWARHPIQALVIAVVRWQAVGHVTSGGESEGAWCPLGGIEGAWTVVTTGRTWVTDTSCIGCLECVGACPSQNGLAVTLAMPALCIRRTPPATEPDLQAATASEIMR
jgi:Fe-S-cluster-containing hydrogenase component 2